MLCILVQEPRQTAQSTQPQRRRACQADANVFTASTTGQNNADNYNVVFVFDISSSMGNTIEVGDLVRTVFDIPKCDTFLSEPNGIIQTPQSEQSDWLCWSHKVHIYVNSGNGRSQ